MIKVVKKRILISKQLPSEQIIKETNMETFCGCLEQISEEAWVFQISGFSSSSDRDKKCHICQGDHLDMHWKRQNDTALQLSVGESKLCHVCYPFDYFNPIEFKGISHFFYNICFMVKMLTMCSIFYAWYLIFLTALFHY